MITLSSTGAVLAALRSARNISLLAYTLRPGAIEDALLDAARRGAHVRLRLEGRPFHDPDGRISADNQHAVDAVRAAGGDARMVHLDGTNEAPLHVKAVLADDALFLDDRNWPGDDADTILLDTFAQDRAAIADAVNGKADEPTAFFAVQKHDALASESRLLRSARVDDDVIVETESFGAHNAVFTALEQLAKEGVATRLLVASRDLDANLHERDALQTLASEGVAIRIIDADEKFALVNGRGWVGSANATAAFDRPDQIDWGARTDQPEVVTHLRDVFERRWKAGVPLGDYVRSLTSAGVI